MIRLGQLKAVAKVAEPQQQGREQIIRKYATVVTKEFPVDFEYYPHVKNYVEAKQIAKEEQKRMLASRKIEIQDFYLADTRLPSNLGRIPKKISYEIIDWASWLRLIRPRLFSLSALGHVLKNLQKESLAAFDGLNSISNPFAVGQERPFFLYALLAVDGDLLLRLYARICQSGARNFDRLEAVDWLREALDDLLQRSRSEDAYSRYIAERKKLQALIQTLDKEKKKAKSSDQRSGKPKRALTGIQFISPRLENFVDIALLENSSGDERGLKLAYKYNVTSRTKKFVELGKSLRNIPSFLSNGFFAFYTQLFESSAQHSEDSEAIFEFICKGYGDVGRGIGPTPIAYAALSGSIRALNDKEIFFEAGDALDTLIEMREKRPNEIFLSGGEVRGRPQFVTLSKNLLSVSSSRE